MATIRRRGDSWQAQVRRAGYEPQTRTFARREDAQRWARSVEFDLDRQPRGTPVQNGSSQTLGELLARYEAEITPLKRSNDRERDKIRVIKRSTINNIKITDLRASHIRQYRDDRLKIVKPATAKRELAIIRHCISVAIGEWGLELGRNPGKDIVVKNADQARSRRLSKIEFERLTAELDRSSVWYLKPIVVLALETGMRRGEILAIRKQDVKIEDRLLHIPHSKNGSARTIPLTKRAFDLIMDLKTTDPVFPIKVSTLRQSWKRLTNTANLDDFRFHDLRHEALSRFAELGLSISEISLISGHKTAQMLFRYTHARADIVAKKLARLSNRPR
jgi:integrase